MRSPRTSSFAISEAIILDKNISRIRKEMPLASERSSTASLSDERLHASVKALSGENPGDLRRPPFESLSDAELHKAARRLTARSNLALADLLAHLGEIDARGIHRDRACASLYTYCIYELRMSEDSAFRRAKAARIVREHPELHGAIARGELHLTALLMIAPLLGGACHAEVLERARFRTKREIARLVAELDPKDPVPPSIQPIGPEPPRRGIWQTFVASVAGPARHLGEGNRPGDWLGPAEAARPEGESWKGSACSAPKEPGEGDLACAEHALEQAETIRREAPSEPPLLYEIRFTAGQEYVDLLEEARDLLGGPRAAARLPEVQLRALRELVEKLRKRRTGTSAPARRERGAAPSSPAPARRERGAAPSSPAPARRAETALQSETGGGGRAVPVAVRRIVWQRDGARCAYVDARGRRCRETHGLEVHHRLAHALGGPATAANLELRCRAHNLLAAEQDFGRAKVRWMQGVETEPPRPHDVTRKPRPASAKLPGPDAPVAPERPFKHKMHHVLPDLGDRRMDGPRGGL